MILLDTHALIWLASERKRLSSPALEAIESGLDLAIAVVSVQEIAYLVIRERLALDRPVSRWIADVLGILPASALPANVSTSIRAGSLDPQSFHGDPIDRLIYATAVEHDARLVTADEHLHQFDPERMVW